MGHSLPTDSTWQSAYDAVTVAGASHVKARIYATTYTKQRKEGKSAAWASVYAEQTAQSKTPQEASAYADKTARIRSAWGNEIWQCAYSGALLASQSHAVAKRYAEVCLIQRRLGQSIRWVAAYARKLVIEGKSHNEAHAYADEVEQAWGTLDALSTMTQPGDTDGEGLTAKLYKIGSNKGTRPVSFAKNFADCTNQDLTFQTV